MLRDFTKDKFDILIQAGQSNAEGAGFGPVEEPYQPDGRVWYLNQNGMLTLAAEEVWYNDARGNFALPFAREYLRAGMLSHGRRLCRIRGTALQPPGVGLSPYGLVGGGSHPFLQKGHLRAG